MTLPEIKEALLLRVQPGDAIVLKVTRALSGEEVESLKDQWLRVNRGGPLADAKLIILDEGSDLTVLRATSENEDLTKIARESFAKTTGGS